MDLELKIALAAVVMAGLTLIVTSIISAYSAWFSQRAARAAEQSAASAKDSVDIARKATEVAADGLRVNSEQLELARQSIDRADQPDYDLSSPRMGPRGWNLRLVVAEGPPADVSVRFDCERTTPLEGFEGAEEWIASSHKFTLEWFPLDVAAGSSFELRLGEQPDDMQSLDVKATIRAVEKDVEKSRQWSRVLKRRWELVE